MSAYMRHLPDGVITIEQAILVSFVGHPARQLLLTFIQAGHTEKSSSIFE